MKTLAIVINYNNLTLTRIAIACLDRQTVRPQILVVDNSSDEAQVLAPGLLPGVEVQRTSNRGFGAAVNCGLRCALSGDYNFAWLVNNDTEMPTDALERCLERAQLAGGSALVSPLLTNGKEVAVHAGSRLEGILLRSRYVSREEELQTPLSWLTAASLIIPTRVIRQVGMFDESRFFMYWEDADYCVRARKLDVQMCIAERCTVLHFGGVTSSLNQERLFRWHLESFHNFGVKHRVPRLQLYLCMLVRWLKWSCTIGRPVRFSFFYKNSTAGAADC